MGIVSASTLIRLLSFTHIALGYILLTNPVWLAEHNVVVVLGEAMELPRTTDFYKPTEATAFAGLLLALLGITDLVAAGTDELTALEYWSSSTPVRLLCLFVITAYTYLFRADGLFGSAAGKSGAKAWTRGPKTPGELVTNDLIFSAGFLEMCAWFWVFVLVREQRRDAANRIGMRRKAQQEEMR